MTDGMSPDTSPGHQPPSRRRGQWPKIAVVAAGIAVATVAVPPLITPHHDPHPTASSPARQPVAIAPSVPSAAPSAAVSSAARFTPITIEAEDPRNTLSGGAATTTCGTCRGGGRVRYICLTCRVTVRTTVPVAGRRTVTVAYETDGDRSLKVSVNGAPARTWQVRGSAWTTPHSFRFTADLPAGPLRLSLYNDESPAPDVDQVVIS
ncbi:hypothetical protein HH310_18430 [Actinoplanes sp. TBRC 11911]|uniref:hypothetical protein n=1 Tax=Actinoplanes sp. TBRC 11911 TaxID=2729386 RepID=UPI00145E1659|nr:hypothetical protein [Actinoplanes sp. TBRC 11911]NMO53161.1 hypothetical protein [Actinoplanes sp. TBRC 11911]